MAVFVVSDVHFFYKRNEYKGVTVVLLANTRNVICMLHKWNNIYFNFSCSEVYLCINVRLAYLYRRSKYWILPSIEAREICHRFTMWSNSKLSSQSTRKVCEGCWVLVGSCACSSPITMK